MLQSDTPKVIDLFSGAGGTGLGFKEAGFQIVGAVELNDYAADTYEKNLGVQVKRVNIRDLTPQQFREELNLQQKELDVLVGCPPCQGFSRMRNHEGAEDERNDLVILYLEFVQEFMPRFAVFENVPGLIRTEHGLRLYNELCKSVRELGYALVEREVDVADYGVAQHRKRVIVMIGRDGEQPPFPVRTHGQPDTLDVSGGLLQPWLTVRDEIGNNRYPRLRAGENGEQGNIYPNHIAPKTGRRVLNFIRMVPNNGGSRTDVPEEFWLQCHRSHKGHTDVYGRLAWDKPSVTITAGCTNISKGRFVHPEQHRALTPREAAALQGFPNDFIFYGKCLSDQIGNAVPPPLASAIATELKNRIFSNTELNNQNPEGS